MVLSALGGTSAAQASPGDGSSCRVLAYAGGPRRPAYTVADFTSLLATLNEQGSPRSPLCDGIIFLEFRAVSGRYYMPWQNGSPSDAGDWSVYLDSLFSPGGPIARLDSAIELLASTLPDPKRVVGVTIMTPYPDPRVEGFETNSARAAAVQEYLREARRRFDARRSPRAALAGFYWLNEGILPADTVLVRTVAGAVHGAGVRFCWIPSYDAAGYARWRDWGFDTAWLQPNYFFHPELTTERLDSAVARARRAGMGLELEFDQRLFDDTARFADRLEPYLRTLAGAPDLRAKGVAVYDGAGALIRLARSANPRHRQLYQELQTVLRAGEPL